MKRIFLLAVLGIAHHSFSQNDAKENLQKLTVPTSPAAAITDMQPTTVLNPKSYNALETALYNNFTDGGSIVIPKDLGIEFTPYWAKERRISMDDYLYPTIGQSFVRNASFSISSNQNYLLGDSTKSNVLGFGIRTSIYFPKDSDKKIVGLYRDSLNKTNDLESKMSIALKRLKTDTTVKTAGDVMRKLKNTLIDKILQSQYTTNRTVADSLASAICADSTKLPDPKDPDFTESFAGVLRSHLSGDDVYTHFKSYLRNRQGFSLDLAAATMVNFPTNDMEFSYAPKSAIWIMPTYRFWVSEKHVIKAMAVYRYQGYNLNYYRSYFPNSTIYGNNNDFGASVSAEFNKCSVQFELVGRASNTEVLAGTDANNHQLYYKEKKSDVQYVLVANYQLTDQAILTFNLGNRFDPILNPGNKLISTLTLNFGFGAPKSATIDLAKTRQ